MPKKFTVLFNEADGVALKALAEASGRSIADVIRSLVRCEFDRMSRADTHVVLEIPKSHPDIEGFLRTAIRVIKT